MTPTPPLVQGELLTYQQDGQSAQVTVGSAEWFRWLETASTFTYRTEHGTFTARLERSGNKRGGTYWRAYRKRVGKLRRAYLGKSGELTLERLQMVAALLAGQGPGEETAPDKASEPEAAPLQSIQGPEGRKPSASPTLMLRSTPPQEPAHRPSSDRGLPTGTTTLLFTDIEGSTRLLQRLGRGYADVLTAYRQLLRAAFEQHQGHEVDTQGDAFFVAFARASDAVAAALAAQRALVNHAWPEGVAVRVRMGLHTGESLLLPEGYVGLDTHLAARIMSAAHGGQVLLSQTTRELVEHVLPEGVSLQDLGENRLKDVPHSTHLFQLVIEGFDADFPPLRTVEPNTRGDPLLTTKLHQPRPRSRLVSRSHLVERLQQSMERTLTLVSAPAGFGKTTLLAQWLAESDTPVAWLSLESEDNDPVRFLTYLIAALQRVDAHVGGTILDLVRSPQSPSPETVVTLLTNELLRREVKDFALVLDDYHVITAEPLHRALAALVEHSPPQLHLVLVTRADPPLPLARLRAHGQLLEVRSSDLRFSAQEASTFLRTIMDVDLSPEQIAALERRTEGWIAGLQLTALAMRGRTDVSGFLAAFTGGHRFVLDYLSEEVLAQQPTVVQSFLLHSSVLGRLSGPLCDAVTGQEGSQAMLEALERANLFVIALDDERGWYRYHHLFAEVLRSCLQQTEPTLGPELHYRASVWYEEHGFAAEAVQHALASSDFERAASLIERRGRQIILQGQIQMMLAWLGALPDAVVYARLQLSILYAIALQNNNQLSAALSRLQAAEQHIPVALPAEQARLLLAPLTTIRSSAAFYVGDLARGVAFGQDALDSLPETERETRPFALMEAAHAFLVNGDVRSSAESPIKEAQAAAEILDSPFLSLRSLILLARMRKLQGRLHHAAAIYQQASQSIPTETELSYVAGGFLYEIGLGDLLREWNDLKQASRHLSRGLELIRATQAAEADVVTEGYIALARLQQASGDYSQAQATLDACVALADARSYVPHLLTRVAAVRAHLEVAQGDLPTALSWAGQSGLSPNDAELPYPREREYLTLARVRIAQGREDPAGPFLPDALHLLNRLLQEAEAKARMGNSLEMLILQALVLHAQHDRKGALLALQRALTMAAPEGYIRLFVDEGVPMQVLLRQIRPHMNGSVQGYVATLLSTFGHQPASPAPLPSSLVEPLTEREREVLRLLLEGASNREIARRLVLSINTVKRHIYNLCGKLGVQSRTQAIVKARALDLG